MALSTLTTDSTVRPAHLDDADATGSAEPVVDTDPIVDPADVVDDLAAKPFRALCHRCGPVIVQGSAFSVRFQSGPGMATCRFECTRCHEAMTIPTSPHLARLLVKAGARIDSSPATPHDDVDDDGPAIDLTTRVATPMTPLAPATRTLRPTEAAALLHVTTAQLRRFERAGRLVTIRTVGQHRRYREDDVLALHRFRELRGG